jgi:transcription elongation factor GreA
MIKTPMTIQGSDKLKEELHERKAKVRPQIVQAIAEARAHGDLKENAEYHAAREQQSFNEGRIRDIEAKLSNATVIDVTNVDAAGKVVFGATVEIYNVDNEETFVYRIVGEDEADIKSGLISINSPIARALIGKSDGEIANCDAPGGEIEYEILSVTYV